MITLTSTSNDAPIDLIVAHIVSLSPFSAGGTTVATTTNIHAVRETREEVRAMVEAALRPTEAADVAAARQAARLLHRVADVVRDDKVTGFSSGDIGEAMDACLGIQSATWRETADELDRLADRLAAP